MRRIFILLLLLLFAACSSYREITLSEPVIKEIDATSPSDIKIKVAVGITNPTSTKFRLTDAAGDIFRLREKIAVVLLTEEIEIEPKFSGKVEVPLQLKIENPLALLKLGMNISSLKAEEFTADITATVKGGALKKEFKFKDVAIDKIVNL